MGLAQIMGKVGLDGTGFKIGAKSVESEAQRLGTSIASSLKGQLAGILGAAFFEQAIQKTIQFGAQISDLAKRAGMTAEAFQKMGFAFGDNDKVAGFVDKLQENRFEALQNGPGSSQAKAFSQLGVSMGDLKTADTETLMNKIGKAIQAGSADALKEPLKEVGGRAAGEMVAGFKAGIEERARMAVEAGAIMSNADAARMKQIQGEWKLLTTSLAVDFVPVVDFVIRCVEDLIASFKVFGAFMQGLAEDPLAADKKRQQGLKNDFAAMNEADAAFHADTTNPEKLAAYNKAAEKYKADLEADSRAKVNGMDGSRYDNAMNAAQAEQAKQDAIQKARDAYVAAHGGPDKPDMPPAPSTGTQTAREETSLEKMNLHVDSLAKIGGFVGGAGAENAVTAIQRRSLEVQTRTAGGVETIVKFLNGVKQSTSTSTGSLINQ